MIGRPTLTFTPQSGKDTYPSYYTGSYPQAMRDTYRRKWHEENDPKVGAAGGPVDPGSTAGSSQKEEGPIIDAEVVDEKK